MSQPPALGHSRACAGTADEAAARAIHEANRENVIVVPCCTRKCCTWSIVASRYALLERIEDIRKRLEKGRAPGRAGPQSLGGGGK